MENKIIKDKLRFIYKLIRKDINNNLKDNLNEKIKIFNGFVNNLDKLLDKITENEKNIDKLILSAYYPIKDEVNVLEIMKNINKNFISLLPTMNKENYLDFYEYEFKEENLVSENKFGVREPDINKCKKLIPNIIITPLLSFDKNLQRLGYGKGFYDKTFHKLKDQNIRFTSIGIAYDEQFYNQNLSSESHDVCLDYIVTPSKIFYL